MPSPMHTLKTACILYSPRAHARMHANFRVLFEQRVYSNRKLCGPMNLSHFAIFVEWKHTKFGTFLGVENLLMHQFHLLPFFFLFLTYIIKFYSGIAHTHLFRFNDWWKELSFVYLFFSTFEFSSEFRLCVVIKVKNSLNSHKNWYGNHFHFGIRKCKQKFVLNRSIIWSIQLQFISNKINLITY